MSEWSKSAELMIAGRTVQGFGGDGIIALSEVLIADLVRLRERGKYFGLSSIAWVIGTIVGPIIRGSFAVGACGDGSSGSIFLSA
ncbi:hypothetical protein V1511DRAFT_508176 [Dipodascopsis uninucleata]